MYKANGVQCFLLTLVLWAVGSYGLGLFPADWQYKCSLVFIHYTHVYSYSPVFTLFVHTCIACRRVQCACAFSKCAEQVRLVHAVLEDPV